MAPKRLNWDLKRDIAPKLEILKKKTERAILELIRKRTHTLRLIRTQTHTQVRFSSKCPRCEIACIVTVGITHSS